MKIDQALEFLEEIDRLKDVHRQCLIMSGKREENTAEHSYSLAMAALTLQSFSNHKIDLFKTLKMALFHDLVEIYAGDNFHYHKEKNKNLANEEEESLEKILSSIGELDLAVEIKSLWHEFEAGKTPEAKFLRGVDRFLPMFHNFKTDGHSWIKHKITMKQALEKNAHIEDSSSELWAFTKEMLKKSKERSYLL